MTRRSDAEAGKVRLGCLFTLLVLAAVGFFGFHYLEIRVRWYQVMDTVQEQASFASAIDDVTIRSRLMAMSDRLELPYTAQDWKIRRIRDGRGRVIEIEAPPYSDSVVVDLPGIRKVWYFTFTPSYTEVY